MSHSVDQYYGRAVSNIIRYNDIVFSAVAATEVLDSMIAKSRVESGVVLLTGSPTDIFNKEVPTLILKTPQDTLGTQAQHVQLQPNLDFYSVVLESELLGPTLQVEKKSEPSESNTSSILLPEQNISSVRPVTHIEIIRQKPNAAKTKHAASRRVTGANRVVPLLTSMWQKRELKGIEPSLAATYRTILDNPDNTHEHECELCHKQFLSVTQVESHIKEMHPQQQVVLEQVGRAIHVKFVSHQCMQSSSNFSQIWQVKL